MQGKTRKRPPYDFILEELGDVVTAIKPMFGAYGIYRDHQILMILRKKKNSITTLVCGLVSSMNTCQL